MTEYQHKCTTCGKPEELRPYGKNGSLICFYCAMATPESKKTAEEAFALQFDACGSHVVIGGEAGPVPLGGIKH